MKLALVGGLSGLAMIVGVTAANSPGQYQPEHLPDRISARCPRRRTRGNGTPLPARTDAAICASNTPMSFAVTATTSRARLQRRLRKSKKSSKKKMASR